jgi:peptide/nickel transport system substrate-binding protein
MPEQTIADLAEDFRNGRLTRRRFVRRMVAAGLSLPLIAGVLDACGASKKTTPAATGSSAQPSASSATAAATAATFQPTKRGGGGTLKLLFWQGPTLLNPHLATGTKDYDGSRVFYEPLADFDSDANLIPILAAEAPSLDNGGVAKDGASVTWKLKQGVTWHDGQQFTADDVVFTYQFVSDKSTGSPSLGSYLTVASVDKVDDFTVKVSFKQPVPFWQIAFVGSNGMILPKHLFAQYQGAQSRTAPYNLKPVGTGPYKFTSFNPGDSLIADIYDKYHVANRPFFDHFELKGGGDAVSAARAVLQTGDYDYGWNMQVAYDQLLQFQKGGPGMIVITPGAGAEFMLFNPTDPNTEVDGERSSLKSKHPFFSDPNIRKAFALMINRKLITDQLYGKEGDPGLYEVVSPAKYVPSPPIAPQYDLQKAAQLLDAVSWTKGSDGIREKDGKKMHVTYATSVNDVRQNTQAIIKKDLESQGIQVDLKATSANVFFGDSTNPDSYPAFFTDMEEYANGPSVDPQSYMRSWVASINGTNDNIAQKANNWSQPNVSRYVNPAYDALWKQAANELDPIKRADLFKQMNQLVNDDAVATPIVNRNGATAIKKDLHIEASTWALTFWKLPYWYRTS